MTILWIINHVSSILGSRLFIPHADCTAKINSRRILTFVTDFIESLFMQLFYYKLRFFNIAMM